MRFKRSGRSLSREWRDKKPFTRRVRWYCKDLDNRNSDIRLEFIDSEGSVNRFYGDSPQEASRDWERFKAGETTTTALREQDGFAAFLQRFEKEKL